MTDSTRPHSSYWHRKLGALLHDSPDKAVDILTHEWRAKQFKKLFNLEPNAFNKIADFDAAAADRLPFPEPEPDLLRQDLDGLKQLPHPLGGAHLPLKGFQSVAEAEEISAKTMPFLMRSDDPRALFLCAWRFWRNWASHADARFAFLPADTRIPDHTIWNHLQVTTAFQGALPGKQNPEIEDAPRLLLFSLGPVQDFIAAARSTRDLWSGSYLLSYLVSKFLGDIALEFGPDHVLFPNLLDQPLLDLRLREHIFDKHHFAEKPMSIWEGFGYTTDAIPRLLTPSLPNRFLALLPARDHKGKSINEWIASRVEDLKDELFEIRDSVADFLEERDVESIGTFDRARFDQQCERLLEIHWQTLPIPRRVEDLDAWMEQLPADEETETGERNGVAYAPRKAFAAIQEMIRREGCKPQYPLRTTSNWGGLNALIAHLHDGAKAARIFDAWREGRWSSGITYNKDALNGREEAVLSVGDKEAAVKAFCSELEMSQGTLKQGEILGASTLLKRFWWQSKENVLGLTAQDMREHHPMPNTRSVAMGRPFDFDTEEEDTPDDGEKYFAILALDGDEMGKWISGSKSPDNKHCLSPKAQDFYEKKAPDFLTAPRTLTPSWHLQFSEALGNFSFHCAQRIVEAFDGRLLYAGGDDVLAMLPAADALPCARALRAAFRGEEGLNEVKGTLTGAEKKRHSDRATPLFAVADSGYLKLSPKATNRHGDKRGLLSDPVSFPVLVPGPKADVSVGIAIAHFKAPLQDVVRAAQAAEKRAKRKLEEGGLGRGAFAISLFKRSGEQLDWGAKWDSYGHQSLDLLCKALNEGQLNARFPHKFEALLAPYRCAAGSGLVAEFADEFPDLLEKELDHCLHRNEGGSLSDDARETLIRYWEDDLAKRLAEDTASPSQNDSGKSAAAARRFDHALNQFINLLRTAAWMKS